MITFQAFLALVFALGVCAIGKVIFDYYGQRRLARFGVIADGSVVNRAQERIHVNRRFETRYLIYYRFAVGIANIDQKIYQGSQHVSETKFNKTNIGDQVEVIYLPNNPTVSRLVDHVLRRFQPNAKHI